MRVTLNYLFFLDCYWNNIIFENKVKKCPPTMNFYNKILINY